MSMPKRLRNVIIQKVFLPNSTHRIVCMKSMNKVVTLYNTLFLLFYNVNKIFVFTRFSCDIYEDIT